MKTEKRLIDANALDALENLDYIMPRCVMVVLGTGQRMCGRVLRASPPWMPWKWYTGGGAMTHIRGYVINVTSGLC